MAAATTKSSDATQAFEAAASEAASQAKDMFESQVAASEKAAKAGLDLMQENYKLGQGLLIEGYQNLVANTNAWFDGVKALTATKDPAEFAKVSQEQMVKGYETMTEQGQAFAKNYSAAATKSFEAAKAAMDKTLAK